MYPTGTTDTAFVTSIYTNLFNSAPDAAGLAYWVAKLTATETVPAEMTRDVMIEAMKNGATGTDATIIANKATVGLAYADAGYESTDISLASVTEVQSTVDAMLVPVTAASHTLTTDTDIVESTGIDTVTATSSTFGAADIISDNSSTDADVMNITATAALAAGTITKIETINVNANMLAGSASLVDASNITGATINIDSAKLGFDGVTGVVALGANTVIVGDAVTELTVTGVNGGTVNAGSATTVNIDASATTKNGTVVVNDDITLVVGASTVFKNLTINATAAVDVDLTGSSAQTTAVIVTGASDVTLTAADTQTAKTITNSLTAGTLTASIATAGAVDAHLWDVDTISADVDMNNNAITVASGANVVAGLAQTSMELAVSGTGTADVVNLSTGFDHATDLTFTGVETANITATDDITIDSLVIGTNKVYLFGSNDVTITTTNGTKVYATAMTGDFEVTLSANAEAIGGAGANTITMGGAATTLSYTGGNGVDTIDGGLTATGTIAASLGAGNDVVKIDNTFAAGRLALDGGTGTDTLLFTATATSTTSAATFAVTNFETLAVKDAAASAVVAQTATVTATQLVNFENVSIVAPTTGTSDDTLVLTVNATTASSDLSTVNVTDTDAITLTINGTNGIAKTIVGTNADDTIDAGTGTATAGNTITGAAGDDTFFFAASDSSVAAKAIITDFKAGALTAEHDTLDLAATTVAADKSIDVAATITDDDSDSAADALDGDYIYTAAQAIFADATSTVTLTVADGVMSLTGLTADKALANTLAEMVTLAQTVLADDAAQASVAFEFSGNTYVVQTAAGTAYVDTLGDDTDNALSILGAVQNVIQLTGVTGVTAMDATGGANTILLA